MLGLSQHVKAAVKTAVRSARTRVVPNVTTGIYFETSSSSRGRKGAGVETFAGHYLYINILVIDRYIHAEP